VAEKITALGRKAVVVRCDVSEQDQVEAAVEKIIAETGKIDILVCSAGIASRGASVRNTSTEEMRRVLDTHVMGSFWCCQAVIDSMRAEGRGDIVIISSVASRGNGANGAPYNMAKTALNSLAITLSKEEGPNGIRVNAIGPGLVETEMGSRLSKARGAADIKDLYKTYPFGRVCQPEDIANLAAYLCSDEGGYISGQVIYVDGGGFIRPTA
jgi:NAD(P)-dependent dehydrogenase (short-subunit alcohol dehydrogenase family)